ncbi:MAG: hypothetical protein ACYCSX_12060 [Acidimicrobiales bacterium]
MEAPTTKRSEEGVEEDLHLRLEHLRLETVEHLAVERSIEVLWDYQPSSVEPEPSRDPRPC